MYNQIKEDVWEEHVVSENNFWLMVHVKFVQIIILLIRLGTNVYELQFVKQIRKWR